jgi:hypothetical protein
MGSQPSRPHATAISSILRVKRTGPLWFNVHSFVGRNTHAPGWFHLVVVAEAPP